MNEGYKQTDIGLIPDDWDVKKIGELDLDINDGNYGADYPRQEDFIHEGIPFIRANNIKDLKIIDEDMRFISHEKHDYLTKGHLKFNDILLTNRGQIGKVAIVPARYINSNINAQIVRLNTNEKINSLYLLYYFNSPLAQKQFTSLTSGTTLPQLPQGKLRMLIVILPELIEQKKIAFILSKIQQAIETQEQIIKTTQELKKALMQKLFTEGLNGELQKQTEIGPIPESWELVTIADVCEQRKESYIPDSSGNLIYVGLEHITSGEYYLSNHSYENTVVSSKYKFYPTDLLYGKLRPYLDKAVVSNISGVCSTDIIVIKPKIDKKFLLALLHSESLLKHAIATTSGVNHPRTSFDSLSKFKFALPKESEQGAVGELLFKLEDKILLNKRANQEYNDALKTMLNLLMTGQVRVKDLEFDIEVMNG